MRLLPARRDTSHAGQAMAEFALLLPLFALFLVIAIDFGRVFYTYIQVTNASREAANYAANLPADEAGMLTRAQLEANTQGQSGEGTFALDTPVCHNSAGAVIACATSTGGAGAGNTITVTASQEFDFLTPLVEGFFPSFEMRSSSTAAVLGYAASGSGPTPPPAGTCSLPVPSFTVVVTSGLSIEVDPGASTPQSPGNVCNISGYYWYWGDGTDSPGLATAATYTYTAAATYIITLEVTNQAGLQTTTRQVTVPATSTPSCDPPNAAFTYSTSGPGGKTHTYTDTSSVTDPANCPIVTWEWTFPDGTKSNAPNPAAQTYGDNKKHTTTLTVTNAGGSDTFSWNH